MPDPIHIAIYYWPHPFPESSPRQLPGVPIEALAFKGQKMEHSFPVSFEKVLAAIEEKFGAYSEGDGSFGFSGNRRDGSVWKVSGSVFESDSNVNCADVWLENCVPETFIDLLSTFETQPDHNVIQLLEHGCFVTCEEFCKLLEAP